MSDNLKAIETRVDEDINPSGAPGSILAQNHNEILKEVLSKVGKYSGSAYLAHKNLNDFPSGTMSWNNNSMNNTTNFVITVSKLTANLNDFGEFLSRMSAGGLIRFKDYVGRSVDLIFQSYSSSVDASLNDIYNIVVQGVLQNINYTYQDDEQETCVFTMLNSSTGGGGMDPYDPTGETNGNLQNDKITFQTAVKEVREWTNEPIGDSLIWDGIALTIDRTLDFDPINITSNHEVTFASSGHVRANVFFVQMTFDGTSSFTMTPPSGIELTTDLSFTNGSVPSAGVYDLSITFIGGKLKFSFVPVQIVGVDTQAPTISSITVENSNPNEMIIVFDEPVNGSELGFAISGTTSSDFDSISGSGTNTLVAILNSPVLFGENVFVSYDQSIGDIEDNANNPLVSFTNLPVTNNTIEQTPPTIISADVLPGNLNELVVVFSDICTFTNLGYTFRVDSVNRSLSAVSGSGTNIATFTISGVAIDPAEVLDLSYNSSLGDTIKQSNSVELADFNQIPVNNAPEINSMSDDFNGQIIDNTKWNVFTPANTIVAQNNQLEISVTGASTFPTGVIAINSYGTVNDLIICQAYISQPLINSISMVFGITIEGGAWHNADRAQFARDTTTLGAIRLIARENDVNIVSQNTGIASNKHVRIKYVPSTNAVTWEYWDETLPTPAWVSFGATSNVDLGNRVTPYLIIGNTTDDANNQKVIYDDFFISDSDYSTQFPSI